MKRISITAFAFLLLLSIPFRMAAQDEQLAIAAADSSAFSVNAGEGWELFNSYVAAWKKDSVQLEIIVQHTQGVNMEREHYIGKLRQRVFFPGNEQTVSFTLTGVVYSLRITRDGNCFLRRLPGKELVDDKTAIPVFVYYKK